jgi:flagellar motor switch protein FliN
MAETTNQTGAEAAPSVAVAPAPPPAGDISLAALGQYPNLEKVLNLELPVIVVLAEKPTTLEEVLNLNEGSVIVFKKHNSEPLDILINNRRIGAGRTIKIGERFGVHVREVGTPQELLAKLR